MANIFKTRLKQASIPFEAQKNVPSGKILVFAPHADDEIFGCGGALIRHVQQNDPIKVVIITDGSCPITEEQKTPDYTEIRKQESLAAAKLIGYDEPVFLDFPDNNLKLNKEMMKSIKQEIEDFAPENIYFPFELEIHQDHRLVNKAVLSAIKKSKCNCIKHLISFEISTPLYPNYLHDITDIAETLQAAMDCFKSQLKANDYNTKIVALNKYRTYTLPQHVSFAEAYNIQGIR